MGVAVHAAAGGSYLPLRAPSCYSIRTNNAIVNRWCFVRCKAVPGLPLRRGAHSGCCYPRKWPLAWTAIRSKRGPLAMLACGYTGCLCWCAAGMSSFGRVSEGRFMLSGTVVSKSESIERLTSLSCCPPCCGGRDNMRPTYA
jgi:hypothetical protein